MKAIARLAFTVSLMLPLASCGGLRQLQPAFEANHTNAMDLRKNLGTTVTLLKNTSDALFAQEQLAREEKVILALQNLALRTDSNGNRMGSSSSDNYRSERASGTLAGDYQRVQAALAASVNDNAQRKAVIASHPVLAQDIIDTDFTDQMIEDMKSVVSLSSLSSTEERLATRARVAAHYDYYQEVVQLRAKTAKTMSGYEQNVEAQLKLLETHAALFVFAAASEVDIERVFTELLGDEGFEADILNLISSESTKQDTQEVLNVIRDFVGEKD